MDTVEMIAFLVIFASLVLGLSIKSAREELKQEKQKLTNREALEAENSEFDYGHNVNYNSEE